MDDSEIYRTFVSKLENSIGEDAEELRKWEKNVGKNDDAQRNRMTSDARFYGRIEHKTTVRVYNSAILVLAKILRQKPIEIKPKYCPE